MSDSTSKQYTQLPLFIHRAVCTRCHQEYPLTTEFWSKGNGKKSGFSSWCRACDREVVREYYAINREVMRAKHREYVKSHPEETAARYKRWRQANTEKTREYARRYIEKHPDRVAERRERTRSQRQEYDRQRRKARPEKNREAVRRRRLLKRQAQGWHTAEETRELYNLQNGLCFHCNANLSETNYHEDHWIPLIRGGTDYIDNIRLLCPPCNLSKGAKLPHEWDERYKQAKVG